MGTIRKYRKRNGSMTYHAEVRVKGSAAKRTSFSNRAEAEAWIATTEAELRGNVRHNWTIEELQTLYDQPLCDLLRQAHEVHRTYHEPNRVQLCHLISVKTGGCSEDCKYCAQSSRYRTEVDATPLMKVEEVVAHAKEAKQQGVSRICLGAAWRQVRSSGQFDRVLKMVREISKLGVEVCCTLGMLDDRQIQQLKGAGLFTYNHNLDTSPRHYPKIVTSHTYEERLATLDRVARAGISICCGGIIGMGESVEDRLELVRQLATRQPHPDSVPINRLVSICGTPLGKRTPTPVVELARMVAVARIAMPKAMVRLAAGRLTMSDAEQALCFFAGANSIFIGEKLLTTPNPKASRDGQMLADLGLEPLENKNFLDRRLEEQGVLRTLSYRNPDLIDFASNDYLGVASCEKLARKIDAAYEALAFRDGIRPTIGATGSRLLTGNQPIVEELETEIAAYHGGETALLFSSGYAANTGLLSCIAAERDAILLDSQVHASTWDGARLSRAKNYIFRHNDLESLEHQLRRARKAHSEVFICVESLYSMSGDLAPLQEIASLCTHHQAWLIIDEAHATGVLGPEGRGFAYNLPSSLARIYTFGKALGCHGAAIVGSQKLRDYLINRCRTFIYTTAFPLHTLIAIQTIYRELPGELEREREKLQKLITYFKGSTPIQSIPSDQVMVISEQLRQAGLDVRAIRPPTVRKGSECLRICLHSFNTRAQIDQLQSALAEAQGEERTA